MTRFLRLAPLSALIAAPGLADTGQTGRLPPTAVPIHYDIAVVPDAKAMAFTGQETIMIDVPRATRTLTLNAADMTIGQVMLDGRAAAARLDPKAETLTVTPARAIAPGTHRLAIGWSGKIATSASGLFAVDYAGRHGPERMLVTQFEAADGRRFAPMWDEPALKASFTLTTTAPKGQTAFSNMPAAHVETLAGGATRTIFQPTPKMSSYLLFLGQGDVERRTVQAGATEIGIITRRGAIDQGDYALASAKRILAYYNDYFGTPYPLPKLDMIAAPGSSQFFSAMENWGAILYFDRVVLLDPKLSSETERQNIFVTVAHEMAHQWFGDLVTMRWWDALWLNEGFASWMEEKATDTLNPDWHYAAQAVADDRERAMDLDARATTHPIVRPITTVDEVNATFDAISYKKGQAVIRMLEGTVGPDAFRDGVRRYMARYKYGNTVTDQLWAEVAAAAGRPVKPLMDSFTLQGGVPLIRVSEPACVGGWTHVTFSQDRYGGDAGSKAPRRWLVPVKMDAGKGSGEADISGPAAASAALSGCGTLVINPGAVGYFRTLLAPGHAALLADRLATIPLADQAAYLNDQLELGNSGYAPLDRYFAAIDKLAKDADPLIWKLVASQFEDIDELQDGAPGRAAFRTRASALLAPQLARIGVAPSPGEAPAVSQLREQLVETLGVFGDADILARARRLVADGLDAIPAAVREAVVTAYLRHATPEQWERLHAAARTARDPSVANGLYRLLGQVDDPALAQRALDLALTDEATTPNRAALISGVAKVHPALAFDWAAAHAAQIEPLLEASARTEFVARLARTGADPALADRVLAYADRAFAPASRGPSQTVAAGIRYRAGLRARQAPALAAWSTRS